MPENFLGRITLHILINNNALGKYVPSY